MESQGRGRRGCPWGNSQPLTVFYQQDFTEAMSAVISSFAQASAAKGQGGPRNLKRFKSHHSPTFTWGGDLMVVDHWFRQIEKILEAMDITSNVTKIRLVALQL